MRAMLSIIPTKVDEFANRLDLRREHVRSRRRRARRRCEVTSPRYTPSVSSVEHWPDVAPEARWATEMMDELLVSTTRSSDELLARAHELRAKAATTGIDGFRSAYVKLADRFEQAAAARLANA
jgi:hypothetical protein